MPSAKRCSSRARSWIGIRLHTPERNVSSATRTARSTSAVSAAATVANASPVAGLTTSIGSAPPGDSSPPIRRPVGSEATGRSTTSGTGLDRVTWAPRTGLWVVCGEGRPYTAGRTLGPDDPCAQDLSRPGAGARAGLETAAAGAQRPPLLGHERAPEVRLHHAAGHAAAVVGRPPGLGEDVGVAQRPPAGGVHEHQVGVRARRDPPLARPEAVGLRGPLGVDAGHVLVGEETAGDRVEQQLHGAVEA